MDYGRSAAQGVESHPVRNNVAKSVLLKRVAMHQPRIYLFPVFFLASGEFPIKKNPGNLAPLLRILSIEREPKIGLLLKNNSFDILERYFFLGIFNSLLELYDFFRSRRTNLRYHHRLDIWTSFNLFEDEENIWYIEKTKSIYIKILPWFYPPKVVQLNERMIFKEKNFKRSESFE